MALTQAQLLGNNVPSIVNPIPSGIITPPAGASPFRITDVQYDYAIGGVPFFAGESLRGSYFRRQYLRAFAPIRKDQFDNQNTPGEQSLTGWWLKSQSNFFQGGGSQYLDTTVDQSLGFRYLYSEHVDCLGTPYQVSLLPATKQLLSSGNTNLLLECANVSGTDLVLVADAAILKQITSAGTVTSYTMPGGVTTIKSLTSDGTNYYFADTTGVWKGVIGTTGVAATKAWNVPSASGNNVVKWVKGRLVGGLDNNVYELVGGAGPILPTPKFTHQNSAYVFTAIAETPASIMVSGFAGARSQIHRFTVDAAGALPTLSSGVVTADLPLGELVNTIYGYLGAFLAIGTTKGIRVATIDANGNAIYGPLVVKNANGVQAVVGHDRFLMFGNSNNANIPYDGWNNPASATANSGMMRLDLSQNTSTGGYPFCSDLDSHTAGAVVAADHLGTTVGAQDIHVFSVAGHGVYATDTANLEPTGVLFSSKVRFNTLEPKHFKYVYIRTPPITDGSIQVVANDPTGGSTPIFTQGSTSQTSPSLISNVGNQVEWMQLQFNFTRGSVNHNVSPVLAGWLLRGLPGPDRQILITLPLLCFDHENDRKNQKHGYDGFAQSRLAALEKAAQSGNLVTLQDLNFGTSYLVIVDDYEFQQQASERGRTSSANHQDAQTRGGFVLVQCRVVQ